VSGKPQRVWINGQWIRVGHVVAYREPQHGFEIGKVEAIDVDDTLEEIVLTLGNEGETWSVFADHVVIVKGLS
jgi:hypothetical protein